MIDVFHHPAPKKECIRDDVVEMIRIFHEAVGGAPRYARQPPEVLGGHRVAVVAGRVRVGHHPVRAARAERDLRLDLGDELAGLLGAAAAAPANTDRDLPALLPVAGGAGGQVAGLANREVRGRARLTHALRRHERHARLHQDGA